MIKRPDFGAFFLRAISKVLLPLLALTRPYSPLFILSQQIRAVAAMRLRYHLADNSAETPPTERILVAQKKDDRKVVFLSWATRIRT